MLGGYPRSCPARLGYSYSHLLPRHPSHRHRGARPGLSWDESYMWPRWRGRTHSLGVCSWREKKEAFLPHLLQTRCTHPDVACGDSSNVGSVL